MNDADKIVWHGESLNSRGDPESTKGMEQDFLLDANVVTGFSKTVADTVRPKLGYQHGRNRASVIKRLTVDNHKNPRRKWNLIRR